MAIENKVIVIGGNHHNMLGVIRALGENNVKSEIILMCNNNKSFVDKSKYVISTNYLSTEEEIINYLLNRSNYSKDIIIPTSDFAAFILDKNYNRLSKKYIIQNIDKKENQIVKYMDKYNQYKLLTKYDVLTPKTIKISTKKNINSIKKYPIICKPSSSIIGSKADMFICYTEEEFIKTVDYYKNNGFEDFIAQEFIENAEEYNLVGFCNNNSVQFYGLVNKIRIYPPKKGTLSLGYITKYDKEKFSNLELLLKNLHYCGLIDIDLFKIENNFYVNEINFRNSGNSYGFVAGGNYIVFDWINSILKKKKNDLKCNDNVYFRDEFCELKNLVKRNISFKEWYLSRKKAKVCYVYNSKDLKPFIWKMVYSLRRGKKNGF